MTYTPRTTEYAARQTIDGLTDEILGLVNPANDGMLAAWQMALTKAQEMAVALDHACRAIAARPMITGNDALRAVADEPPFSDEPFHEQIRQTVEARRCACAEDCIHPNHRIPVETPQEAEALDMVEARQVDLAKPEVFNLVNLTRNFFGMGKGA